ncbi:MAG: glycosyltransferase family 39 protein, partial [Candidatus Bipolaricaulaceae bacterium]
MESEVVRGLVALGIGFLITMSLTLRDRAAAKILLFAFLLRTALALFHQFILPLPDSQADAIMFEQTARNWASQGWRVWMNHWQSGALMYSWLLAFFYLLFGPSSLMAQAINVCLGTIVVYLVWRIGKEIFGEKGAFGAGWAACFFPTLNLYSALTMREVIFVFLVLCGTLFSVSWFKKRKLMSFAWATLFFVLATGFHLGAWPLIWALGFWCLGAGIAIGARRRNIPWELLGAMAIAGIASAFIVTFRWGWDKGGAVEAFVSMVVPGPTETQPGSNPSENQPGSSPYQSESSLSRIQKAYATGRAAYLEGLVVRSVWDLFWQTPIRIVFFLFTPFPWMVREPKDLIGLFDALLYFALMVCILWSLIILFKTKQNVLGKTIFLLALAAFGSAAFATITSNYGAAIRH